MSAVGRLAGARVVVFGLGRSGRAAVTLALREGATVLGVDEKATQVDLPGAALHLGPAPHARFTEADLVVVSPGIAAAHPAVQAAVAAGVRVVGELGFAWDLVDAPAVGITGTNGKSTVTHFTGHLLGELPGVFVGGNLGTPLSEALLAPEPPRCLVLEVSSYQLELPGRFAPRVGVILNLTPDHLARHGTLEAYAATKARLFAGTPEDGLAVIPTGSPLLARVADGVGRAPRAWLGAHPGVTRTGRTARVRVPGLEVDLDLGAVAVPGAHNLDHAATAALLALSMGATPAGVQARLASLTSLPHRMQPVHHDAHDVLWLDDSKATNVASTSVAVAGLDRAAVVLLGGEAKAGDDVTELAPHLRRHRAVLTFGQDGPAFAAALRRVGVPVTEVGDLSAAVSAARTLARPGDAVLLSPACASFDAFRNFEHRGRVFAALARGESPEEVP